MSYYPEPDGHIRDKVRVVLDLSNYATKKDHGTNVDAFDLVAKKDIIGFIAKVDKLNIDKLVNVSTSLNNSRTKVDDFRC